METRLQYGQLFGILRILLQISYPEVTTKGDLPVVIILFSGNDIQQGGLATAILGNKTDTLSFRHTE